MYRYRGLRQRPSTFRVDYSHSLAQGLVFAGLGGGNCAGSLMYRDSSPYGNHGTLVNMSPSEDWVWDSSLNRHAIDLDGSNDYAVFTRTPSFVSTSGPYTISFWLWDDTNVATLYALAHRCLAWYDGSLMVMAVLGTTDSYTSRAFAICSSSVSANSKDTYGAVGTGWQHYCATYDGTNWVQYCNVKTSASDDGSYGVYTGNTANVFIGQRGNGAYVLGRMSDILVHRLVLCVSEIQQLADPSNVMLSGLILPPRRKFWSINLSTPSINSKRVMFRW